MSSYWLVQEGPSAVPALGSARYVLVAPNTPSMPGVQQESVLFALTDKPATISSARLFAAIAEGTQISPRPLTGSFVILQSVLQPGNGAIPGRFAMPRRHRRDAPS